MSWRDLERESAELDRAPSARDHIREMIEAGGAHECASDCPLPTREAIYREHRLCGPKYEGCYSHWPIPHCRADGMQWPCDVYRLRQWELRKAEEDNL